ncbi:MAG: type I secretion C-terminal target domain-containing protein, partial [Methylococcales bacterium]|nr:type I secretion C-terminal target domain-containing protein [Methylococcales bacterium]
MSYIYGTTAGETLDSSASTEGDFISGYEGNDTIIGSSFADSIDGGEGGDSITAGSGNDTISGGYGSDTIFGEAGDDYFEIYGDASDSINGGDGADKFIIQSGEFGFHTLTGGIGSDTYVLPDFYSKTITITDFAAGAGGDILDVTNLLKNSYNLSSNPFSSSYLRLFTSGSDTLLQWDQDGLGNEYQASWKTIAILQNTTAANFVGANFAPQIPTNGSAVTDIETITGTTGNDQLTGGIGNNSITGLAGDDNLTGLFGNDTLIGGVGQDNLTGGAGNDSLVGGESGSNVDDSGNYLYGGDGNDTLVGGDFGASGDNLDGGRGDDNLSGLLGDDSLNGGEGNDTLSGGIGNDYFTDEAGNNSIVGGDGNDTFDITSTGLNFISGGAGADLYIVHSGNQLRVTDFDSADIFDISELLNANRGDTSGNPFNPTNGYFRLIQDAAVPANVLFQWDIDGTTSTAKTWQTVITFENKAVANFADTNFSPLIPLNGSDVAGVSLTLTTSGTLKGNVGNDTLTSGTSGNTLYGFAGSDTLIGNDGHDNLYGGQGNDLLVGGVSGTNADTSGNYLYGQDGDDTLIGGDYAGQGDRLDGGNGNDSLVGGAGNDTLDGGGSFSDSTLGVDGNDTLEGGLGNDRLYSRGGNDLLTGGDGNDYFDLDFRGNLSTFTTLVGGLGDDTFDLSRLRNNYNPSMGGTAPTRNVTITGGTGIDKYLVNTFVENAVITDFSSEDVVDITSLLNESIGNYSGNPFGTLGYFQLVSSNGDTLFQWDKDGAVGSANTWKTVFTFVGVTSGITAANFIPSIPTDGTTIPAGVSLTATNTSGETVNGNIGNDTLTGSDGYDVLHGFAGNDSIIGGNGFDDIWGGQGNDTLIGGVAGTNADTSSNNLYGGEGNDVLIGGNYVYPQSGYGDNLDGGNGNDSLNGFAGDDNLNGGQGNDTLLGGDGNDTFYDDGGSNSIDGGTGNDTFTVYSENATDSSTLTGGAGSDRFILSTGSLGSLSITDFAAGASGDILDIEEIINSSIGYSGGNLFGSQGYLRLEPSGTGDTLFQWDKDGATGSVNTWQTLVTLTGITATNVTLDNFSTPMSPTGTAVSGQTLTGTVNNDVLHGNVGNDTITGNGGSDQLSGSGGNDLITGSGYLSGDAGNDFITAIVSTYNSGEIIINDVQGGTGYDTLIGSTGDDNFYDYSGSNSIDGGAGNDTFEITSDNAADISTITGGAGSDKFYVSAYSLSAPVVTDFMAGIGGDVINVNSLLTRNTTYTSAAGDPFGSAGY